MNRVFFSIAAYAVLLLSVLVAAGFMGSRPIEFPDGAGNVVVCAGGHGDLDDAAAAMLAQVLAAQGATVGLVTHDALVPGRLARLNLEETSIQ